MTPQQFKAVIDTIENALSLKDGYHIEVVTMTGEVFTGSWFPVGDPSLGVICLKRQLNLEESDNIFIQVAHIVRLSVCN